MKWGLRVLWLAGVEVFGNGWQLSGKTLRAGAVEGYVHDAAGGSWVAKEVRAAGTVVG